MIRKAVKMKVYSGQHEEYKKRHDEIWEPLKKVLKNHFFAQGATIGIRYS